MGTRRRRASRTAPSTAIQTTAAWIDLHGARSLGCADRGDSREVAQTASSGCAESTLALDTGASVEPARRHARMLVGLAAPLVAGAKIELTLVLRRRAW
jgi:hypothetical protein